MLSEKTQKAILDLQNQYPEKRSAIIPALHLAQAEIGYLPREIQDEIAVLFHVDPNEVNGIVSFYDMFFEEPVGKHLLHVCKNLSCMLRGADQILKSVCKKLQVLPGESTLDGEFTVFASECLGACDRAPMMLVDDQVIGPVSENDLDPILLATKKGFGHPSSMKAMEEIHTEMRILMKHIDKPQQWTLKTYQDNGGYQAIRKAIPNILPNDLMEMVKQSGLKGRGGAGFATGMKWSFIPKDPSLPKYLVCNADESEPGTFKDRLLIEKDPHQVIEGMILSCYAIGAHYAVIYCRGEYYEGISKLRRAINEATEKGYLGKSIFGSNFSLNIIVHPGAGAYIAGEETALLNSLEGYRATPRLKPPFPAIAGLYSKPTIVNNVETLANVVHIVNYGAEWYQKIGKPKNTGTKIFQVSGHVQKPGCYEFPLGIPLREVLETSGGMLQGRKFKACYPGGSSCSLLTEHDLDISMDFDTLDERKTALGTASIIVMDDSTDMVQVAHRLMQFYQNESCGKCTPCREGTRWIVQVLARIASGGGTFGDLKMIEQVCISMAANSFCALAVGAAPPIMSAIIEFRNEFEQAIQKNPQANQRPEMKISYPYQKSVS
jgi:NADH-quinone oxidoreductase subunit F